MACNGIQPFKFLRHGNASKVNDGNIYPVVYFSKPLFKQEGGKKEINSQWK